MKETETTTQTKPRVSRDAVHMLALSIGRAKPRGGWA
jgi:hypothetical protein